MGKEHDQHPQFPCAHSQLFSPSCFPKVTTIPTSNTIGKFWTFCKWNHTVFILSYAWLLLFNVMFIKLIHIIAWVVIIHLHSHKVFYYMTIPQFIHSSVDGHLDCFQVLTVMNKASKKNPCTWVLLHICSHLYT